MALLNGNAGTQVLQIRALTRREVEVHLVDLPLYCSPRAAALLSLLQSSIMLGRITISSCARKSSRPSGE